MKTTVSIIKRLLFVLLLLVFVGLIVLLVFFDPGKLIMSIGIRNSLIIAFFISVAGAFTSLTTLSSYPLIISLVAGQTDPVATGLVTGLGMAMGDILFFAFGYSARDLAGQRSRRFLNYLLNRIKKLREWVVKGLIFLYVAATPFPNNLLSGSLALIGFPLKKAMLPIMLGDIFFCLLIAWLAAHGVEVL